ncbi:DUF2190 family protein [Burkholderia anthina]|uniref:DUF2190 family protein n=1 Tax=Burkholderia anthina TaxID=179879 RepID=UPI00158C8C56|nr:DUF2190 family protein [Burkholderia anthina]
MQNGSVVLLAGSFVAAAAVTASRFIGPNSQHAAAGANTIGVSRFDGAQGDLVTVDQLGTSIVEAGAPIAAYGLVEVGADGKAVPHDAGVAVGRVQMVPAQAPGDFVEVMLIPN